MPDAICRCGHESECHEDDGEECLVCECEGFRARRRGGRPHQGRADAYAFIERLHEQAGVRT